jgi:quinol monooxygenase YgiN
MAAGKGVMLISWYATFFRGDQFVDAVAEFAAPVSLEYGATRYTVQRSRDDAYRILQQVWFNSSDDWYRYWEGPEMREFRARYSGRYQIPIVYTWHDEYAAGGAAVEPLTPEDLSATEPAPSAGA